MKIEYAHRLNFLLRAMGLRETSGRAYRYLFSHIWGIDFFNRPLIMCLRNFGKTLNCQTYIDIGAHKGNVARVVADYFQRCMLVEPLPSNFESLSGLVKMGKLKNCEIFPFALDEKMSSGPVSLYISNENDGDNSIYPRADLTEGPMTYTTTLDFLIEKSQSKPPFLIKIDVQGNELHVFKGGASTLQRECVIVSEFWPWGLRKCGSDTFQLIEFLKSRGYIGRSLDGRIISENHIERIIAFGESSPYIFTDMLFLKM